MGQALGYSLETLAKFLQVKGDEGLSFAGDLKEDFIQEILPHLKRQLNELGKNMEQRGVTETPLVSPEPVCRASYSGPDEGDRNIYKKTKYYGFMGSVGLMGRCGLKQSAYIFLTPTQVLADYGILRDSAYDENETAKLQVSPKPKLRTVLVKNQISPALPRKELSTHDLINLWWNAPVDSSALSGNEGLIQGRGRVFYQPKTLN